MSCKFFLGGAGRPLGGRGEGRVEWKYVVRVYIEIFVELVYYIFCLDLLTFRLAAETKAGDGVSIFSPLPQQVREFVIFFTFFWRTGGGRDEFMW